MRRYWGILAALAAALSCLVAPSPAAAGHDRGDELYTPPANEGAIEQIHDLVGEGRWREANLIRKMVRTPQAVWLESGTPAQAKREARDVVRRAAAKREIPVLVVYNLPFRDCAQYSAGGALDTEAYEAWIDGVAAGIGRREAIVIVEPDGLGIIPFNTDLNGNAEWCQPTDEAGQPQPGASPEERYAALNHAVKALSALPNTSVYLDGTHSDWLGVGDIADRLVKAGVNDADGFFLNASNYQTTERQQKYGTWISSCIAFAANPDDGGWRLGHYEYCASQYYPADPGDFDTWGLTDQWYTDNLGSAVPVEHFVVDTSRNGQGPWTLPADHPEGDPEVWCNPPGRGLGLRPTTETGVELLDAYVWIKIPGESDGSCRRWGPGPEDPVRGIVDPPAGAWFDDLALELVANADPPLGRR